MPRGKEFTVDAEEYAGYIPEGFGMNSRECPVCRVRLEDGIIMNKGDRDRVRQSTWVEGEPEKSFWSGTKTKGKKRLAVSALRCPRCGRIELYTAERGD